jgi:hypothetical protein
MSSRSFRWALTEQSIQLLPPTSNRRAFNWSYLIARALRRLNPGIISSCRGKSIAASRSKFIRRSAFRNPLD